MTWSTTLRREIADEFAALTPTQWKVLFNGWMGRPGQYWDNKGEFQSRRIRSTVYQWQASTFNARLLRENQQWERDCNRREAIRKRPNCAGCGVELNHDRSVYQQVRKFCTPECHQLKLQRDIDAIERRYTRRQCVVCFEMFLVQEHQRKICCSKRCSKRRQQNQNRSAFEKRRAQPTLRSCRVCQGQFMAKGKRHVCGDDCAKVRAKKYKKR